MFPLSRIGAGAALAALLAVPSLAQDKQAMIDEALTAAPPQVAGMATVKTHEGETLREGEGVFTCYPGIPKGPGPMCLDEEWNRLMGALMKKEDYKPQQAGIAYMLAGDMPEGGASNVDPFATEQTEQNQWVVEGPHIMLLLPDPVALEALTTDPEAGGPYVMWQGTPYAHVMVPVAPRPE